jgi:hypothetical protein
VAIAIDPGAVAERRIEGLAEGDADVLHRVMGAGLEVAGRAHDQPHAGVAAEQVQHVVEEADPGRGRHVAPVQVELEGDLGLARSPLDGCRSAHAHCLVLAAADSPCTPNPSARASAST